MVRMFFVSGCVLGFLAVVLGAFGAHALKEHFKANADLKLIYNTAVEYHMYHALALFAVAWLAHRAPGPLSTAAGIAFLVGLVVFSGSLYILSITGTRWLGAITPFGGVAMLVGWLCLGLAGWRGLR